MNVTEHLLVCLAEECAEVQQAVAKTLRFGLDDGYPDSGTTNAEDIAREIVDLLAVVELLEESGCIVLDNSPAARERKQAKVRRFMDYARGRGTLMRNEAEQP